MPQTWWPSSVKRALDGLSFTAETQPQTQRLAAQEAQANLQSAGWQPMPEMQAAPAPSAPPAALPEIELPSLEEVTAKWREQPAPPPTSSGTPSAMPQAPGLVNATITQGPKPGQTLQPGESVGSVTLGDGPIVEGDPQGFFQSARAYADAVEREYGIPAAFTLAVAANETGYGQRRYMAGDNNYHGIQDTTGTGTPYRDWRPGPNGEKIYYEARQAGFANPLEGFRGFGRFLTENPRYQPAIQRYRQTGDAAQFARDVHAAGYAEDPAWSDKVTSIMRGVPVSTGVGSVTAPVGVGPQLRIPGPEQSANGTPITAPAAQQGAFSAGSYTPNQINAATSEGLDYETALAVCGPAAAIAFARKNGRNPTMQEAVALAREVGWTVERGMAGPASQQQLLQRMGVASRLTEGEPDWRAVAADVQRGNPVTISTPGHYFVAERYDPESGAFDFGESAAVLKASGGRRWFRPEELTGLGMGAPRATLYIDNPESPTPSIAADARQSLNAGAAAGPPQPAPAAASAPPSGGTSTPDGVTGISPLGVDPGRPSAAPSRANPDFQTQPDGGAPGEFQPLQYRAPLGPADDMPQGGGVERDPRRFIPSRNIEPLGPALRGQDVLDNEQYGSARGQTVDPNDPVLPHIVADPARPYTAPGTRNRAVPGSVIEYTDPQEPQPYGPFDPAERNRAVPGDTVEWSEPPPPAGGRYPNIIRDEQRTPDVLYDEFGNPYTQTRQGAYQAATGRSGGAGVMLRGPLSSAPQEVGNDEPYDPRQYDEGPREAAPTSTYNDPTTTGTISEPIPSPQYDYQIADGRSEPPTPGGVWEPVRTIPNPQRPPAADPATFLAEDSQSTPPPPMADYPLTPPGSPYGDQQAAMEPATDRFAASEPTETQSTLKLVWDAAGNVLGYVQERGGRLAARVLDPQPMQGRTEADQRIIESTRSIRQPIESAVQPAARAIETTIGGPNAPEGSLLQAAQDASGVLGPEGPVRAFGSAVQSARSARVPDVETGLRGVMQAPNTSGAAGVVDDVLESQRPRALPAPAQRMALPEPVPTTSFEDFTRAADSPAQQAAREAASQPYIRPGDNQLLREQFGRPWEEVAPVYPGSANRLGEATQQIVTEGRRIRGPQEQVLPGERSMISPPRTIEPQSISLNSGLAPGPSDLRNAAQGGVVGAASEMTSDEELTPQERLVRIGTGAVLGVAAGRVARGSGQQLGSGFVSSPNYRPPTPAQVQAAQKAGPRRGAMLNQSVTAPSSDVPIRVRAVTAATDDRAGLRWAEDMLSDAAGSPRMRENDPLRPSTQSRVNAGSIANERIQNDLEPAIVNAGRAGLRDELPQYLEDVHQRDILDEFYNRGHAEELAAQQQRIAAAQARGASPATIQRMQQMSQQRAHAAGEQAMRRRQGSNADMTYEAIEARLQAQEARLTADGRWQPLQDAADAVWRHNDDTRQRLFDAGEVDQEWLDYMRQAYPHYVPTVPISHLDNRAGGPMVSNTGTRVSRGSQKSVQALDDVGTSGERLNPIVATRNATVRAERQIQRNRVAQAFAQMMDDALQASPGAMAAGRDHRTFLGGGVDVTYMAGGKPVTMSVPKVVADGLEAAANMSADPGTVGRIWKAAMGFVTSAMTAGRASFLPVNLLRDLQDYALRTTANEGGPQALTGVLGTWLKQAGNAAADIAVAQVNPRGFAGAASGAITGAAVGDEDTTVAERLRNAAAGALTGTFLVGANKVKATGASREFLARGGGSGGLSANWRAGQRWYRDVLNDGGAPVRTPQDAARYLGDWLQDIATLQGVKGINERTELISRTAAMLRADAQKLPATEAMIRGRDASIDFDRAGTVARTVNGIVPFFNATVQGGAQFARLFKQNPAAAAATVTATVAPVLLMTEAWNRSDPTRAQVYDDVPQYIKDTGVVVVLPWAGSDTRGERPNYLWIPTGATTPFVIGMRRAMEGLPGLEPTSGPVGDRPEASSVERWGNTLANVVQVFSPLRGDSASSLASNVVPQGVKQVLELGINKDLYRGNPIVTDNADERASAASRGVASAANAAGRAVGSDFLQNVRPSGVEHLVNALPAYGDIVKGASDLVAPSGFKQAEDRPIQNAPFVGGVAQRFIRDTGGANLQRAQDAALSEGVRSVIQDAGMRPGDIDLSLPASYKSAPLTRDEQLRWQSVFNNELTRAIGQVRRSDQWRNPATREQAVRDAIAAARVQAAERARLPDQQQIENRIRRQQSMKAS